MYFYYVLLTLTQFIRKLLMIHLRKHCGIKGIPFIDCNQLSCFLVQCPRTNFYLSYFKTVNFKMFNSQPYTEYWIRLYFTTSF